MSVLLPLPVVVPLIAVGFVLLAWNRRTLQRAVAVPATAAALAAAVVILVRVATDGPQATGIGGWTASVGIVLVADLTAAMFLVVSLATALGVLVYSFGQSGIERDHPAFVPTYLVLVAGVSLAFLTGDLFNLFVSFELVLVSSYVLLTLGGRSDQVRTGMTYVIINVLASTLFLAALGLVYASTGTVNLALLSERIPELIDPLRAALGLLLLVTFGIKAAVFPLFFWLPDSYPTAPTSITAVFAGLLTKVGVYALVRTFTLFDMAALGPVLLVIAGLTMVIGVLGAIAQDDIKRILSFHIISQIGYMVMGLGLFSVAGLAGTVFFIVHQIPVKAALFLVGGLVEAVTGTSALRRVDGLVHRSGVIAGLFGLAALSLIGVPPFSGFVAKLSLVEAGVESGAWAITAVALAGGLLTMFSMTKIWSQVFWGEPNAAALARPGPIPKLMTGATMGVVAVTLALAVFAGGVFELSREAATDLIHPTRYVTAVLG
jgi:multicomponent Na+:H+ antiporter subunit D